MIVRARPPWQELAERIELDYGLVPVRAAQADTRRLYVKVTHAGMPALPYAHPHTRLAPCLSSKKSRKRKRRWEREHGVEPSG